ncbi:hypothetical protein B0J14DRAFT_594997 [Halenospora varia]|nr:hypothetical protein B0J14DRAFT_594997 [Halenospora varia]
MVVQLSLCLFMTLPSFTTIKDHFNKNHSTGSYWYPLDAEKMINHRGSGIGILPPSRYYDLGEERVWATYKKSPCRHLFRVQTRTGNPMGDTFLRFRKKEFGLVISWLSLMELKNAYYATGMSTLPLT